MRKAGDSDRSSAPTPFRAEDFKYRIDEFLTTGHDDRGQSVRLFFRSPPTLERALEVVRDSRRFPYQTISDIIRHAVIRHVEWLHRMEPDMPRHFISGVNAINEICRDAELLSQIQQTFGKLDAMVEGFLGRGETLEAQHLISLARGQLAKIPDSRWKRDFIERFSVKYARHSNTSPDVLAANILAFPSPATIPTDEPADGPGDEQLDPEDPDHSPYND